VPLCEYCPCSRRVPTPPVLILNCGPETDSTFFALSFISVWRGLLALPSSPLFKAVIPDFVASLFGRWKKLFYPPPFLLVFTLFFPSTPTLHNFRDHLFFPFGVVPSLPTRCVLGFVFWVGETPTCVFLLKELLPAGLCGGAFASPFRTAIYSPSLTLSS